MQKTNVMRLLDVAGITYTTREYAVDESDLSGVHAATLVGLPPEQVFKTLVLQGVSGAYYVCCIGAADELDLKKVAGVCGEKKIDLISTKNLLKTTGYIRGGCSPIGMKKQFPSFIDEAAQLFETISVSAGARGVQIVLNPLALAQYLSAPFVNIV